MDLSKYPTHSHFYEFKKMFKHPRLFHPIIWDRRVCGEEKTMSVNNLIILPSMGNNSRRIYALDLTVVAQIGMQE